MVARTPFCPTFRSGVRAQTEAVGADRPDKLCEAGWSYVAEKRVRTAKILDLTEYPGVLSLTIFYKTIDTHFVLISTPAEQMTTHLWQATQQRMNK